METSRGIQRARLCKTSENHCGAVGKRGKYAGQSGLSGSLGNTEADLCPYHRDLDRIVQMMFSQMQNAGADNQSTLILYGKRSPATKGDPHVEKCAPLFQLFQTRSDIAVDYCPAGKRRARKEAAHAPPI